MSLTNPNTVVTEERLNDFYKGILPYLGGSADAGFTPVGSVIAIMGVTAPANYLACNGQIVNVADYPELANYFEQQFGTKYKFGGSGTTFGIPDLRGEFLRGTGTNSHTNQGSGADVGTHQDATIHPYEYVLSTGEGAFRGYVNASGVVVSAKHDTLFSGEGYKQSTETRNAPSSSFSGNSAFTSRPTNTSILWCIATKDIYLNPSMDYSTSEKVVGKWIDGKTIYQKTIDFGVLPADDSGKSVSTGLLASSIDRIIHIDGFSYTPSDARNISRTLPYSYVKGTSSIHIGWWTQINNNYIHIYCMTSYNRSNESAYVTIQYTKTTD